MVFSIKVSDSAMKNTASKRHSVKLTIVDFTYFLVPEGEH